MSLIVPTGPQWAYVSTSFPDTPTAALSGVSVTAGANNTKGTTAAVLAALSHSVEFLEITIDGFNGAGLPHAVLLDIMIDPAGGTSWSVFIPNLICGYSATRSTTISGGVSYAFPLRVPAGASLGARAQTAHSATDAGGVTIVARGGNRNPATWWAGQSVEAIGVNTATSQGALLTPGASGTYTSWADFGSTTSRHAGAIQYGVQSEGSAINGNGHYIEFGMGGVRIGPPLRYCTSSAEQGRTHPTGIIFQQIAAGSQLQVRANSAGANTDQIGVAAYLVS